MPALLEVSLLLLCMCFRAHASGVLEELRDGLDIDMDNTLHLICIGISVGCVGLSIIFFVIGCFIRRILPKISDSAEDILAIDVDEDYVPQLIINWRLDSTQLELHEVFARGRWGNIHRGTYSGERVVVKRIPMPPVDMDNFYREFSYLIRMRHPNIVTHKGVVFDNYNVPDKEDVFDTDSPPLQPIYRYPPCEVHQHDQLQAWLVSECVDAPSLFTYLHQSTTPLTWKQRMGLAIDIAQGLAYLHSVKPVFAHRTISSHEVYVTKAHGAVLGGMELSALKGLTGMPPSAPPYYQPPEALKSGVYMRAGDVYALGVLVWELATRLPPAAGFPSAALGPVKLLEAIYLGERPCIPDYFPPALVELLRLCWASEPLERPNCEYVLHALREVEKAKVPAALVEEERARTLARAKAIDVAPAMLVKAPEEYLEMMEVFSQLKQEPWLYTHAEVRYMRRIGAGSTGEVWEGTLRNQPVALKRVWIRNREQYMSFLREAAVLHKLRHPAIVLFMGVCAHPDHVCIITELYPRGTLLGTLAEFDYEQCMGMLMQLAEALCVTHGQEPPLLHRDIRTANVLIDGDGNARLADFSLSLPPTLSPGNFVDVGNMFYQSPEVLQGERYTVVADVYSFGMVMWELLARRPPFSDTKMTPHQAALAVVIDDVRPTMPNFAPPDLARLVRQCWDKDPTKRPKPQVIFAELARLRAIGLPRLTLGPHNSKLYVKRHPVSAIKCRERIKIAKTWGVCVSKAGDYLISGKDGDVYSCDDAIFQRTYAPLPGTQWRYKKVQRVFARRCSRQYLINTLEGLEYAESGDYIAQNPIDGEQWPISDFTEAYMLAEDQVPPTPACAPILAKPKEESANP